MVKVASRKLRQATLMEAFLGFLRALTHPVIGPWERDDRMKVDLVVNRRGFKMTVVARDLTDEEREAFQQGMQEWMRMQA